MNKKCNIDYFLRICYSFKMKLQANVLNDGEHRMKKTGAVLVAAGLSSRMREFKPLLPFGNSTISLHIVTMLKKMGLNPIVVVTGYRAEELESHLFSTGVRFVKNERFRETQMFDSVRMGIMAVREECERILIMPMDIPAILQDTFQQVLNIDAPIVRTRYEERTGHPIVVRCDIAETLLDYAGDNGLKGAIAACGVAPCDVEVTDEGVRKDVDTPEEYLNLIRWNYSRGNGYPVHPEVQVRLVASEPFFGPATAELLEKIHQTGSIQEACIQMELSYSKGSSLIKGAERQLGYALVKRWTGGSGGGGSVVTEEGLSLLANYQKMVAQVQLTAEKLYRSYLEREFGSSA